MSSIKFRFFKSCNSLILLLISILGFTTSCKEENDRYEYGAPVNIYVVVKGNVQSAENNQSVPDIIIEARETFGSEEYTPIWKTFFSDNDGNYRIRLSENKTYQLKFVDTDGALNGEYETLDTTVVTNNIQFPKESVGPEGVPEKELNIQLKAKE